MTTSITKIEEQTDESAPRKPHYDQQYPAFSFRISSKTKEILQSIKIETGKSWNQTLLHLAGLHRRKQNKTNYSNNNKRKWSAKP